MKRNLLVAATFSVASVLFAEPSLASESSTFVARSAAVQEHAKDAAHERAVAKQGTASESKQAKARSAEPAQDS